MEIRADDRRLNMYVQSLTWRMQVCGDPVWEVFRMARAFHEIPVEKKQVVFQYGLRHPKAAKGGRMSARVCTQLPEVQYTRCNFAGEEEVLSDGEASDEGADP